MHKITFKLEPVSASRPRVTRWGVYYADKYTQFRKDMAKLLLGNRTLYASPLKLNVSFYFTIPKSYSKKKRDELDGEYCVGVSDLDNLEKALYDCMNGTVYVDDKYIVHHEVKKMWVKEGGRIEVIIEKIK